MSVTTVSSSTSSVTIPYDCRCAFCGAAFRGADKIDSEGNVFRSGYASEGEKSLMGFSSNFRAYSNLPHELDYAEQRLDHFRGIVADGRMQNYLNTGTVRKEDWFRVKEGSSLEYYLKSTSGKTKEQYERDKKRLKAFPYEWKMHLGKEDAVKCPVCGKAQPWSLDTRCSTLKVAVILLFFAMAVILAILVLSAMEPSTLKTLCFFGAIAAPILLGMLVFRLLKKPALKKLANMPWRAEDLPKYDAAFLARVREELKKPFGEPK